MPRATPNPVFKTNPDPNPAQAAASYHAGAIRQQLIQQAFTTVESFGSLPMYQVTKVSGTRPPAGIRSRVSQICRWGLQAGSEHGAHQLPVACGRFTDSPCGGTCSTTIHSHRGRMNECRRQRGRNLEGARPTACSCRVSRKERRLSRCCVSAQAISDLRAKLSNSYAPTDVLKNDDQNILQSDNKTPILVPSNGYTFDRIPAQVSQG